MNPAGTALPRGTAFGLLVLAGSIVLFQIALTRVFAIMMWHHLTYMVVSVALLGFGAAGSLLTATRGGGSSPVGAITLCSAAYGASVVGAVAVLDVLPVDSLELWRGGIDVVALFGVYAVVTVPFLLGGLAVGLALTRFTFAVNRLYFADLLGSALGAAASVALLATVGAVPTTVLAAACGLLAAALFGRAAEGRAARTVGALSLLAALYAVLSATPLGTRLSLPRLDEQVRFAPGKELRRYEGHPGLVRIPSATAEVEVAPSELLWAALGGDVGTPHQQMLSARLVGQDGTAPTMLFEDAGDIDSLRFLRGTQVASPYVVHAANGLYTPTVLVIGVGGGVDVLVALAAGARHVTAVEINAAMIAAVTTRFGDSIGGLFADDHSAAGRIELVHGEGRSFMRSRTERYNVIQMSGVDSFTALSTGAYTLSESYLYTVEAVQEFWEHLTPGGILSYSRALLSYPRKPRESLRLANIAREALLGLGVERPQAHIAVLQGGAWASTLIKRSPFTPDEIAALERFAEAEGFLGLVFDPLHPRGRPSTPERWRADRDRILAQLLGHQFRLTHAGATSGEELGQLLEHLSSAWIAQVEGDFDGVRQATSELAAAYPKARLPEISGWVDELLASAPSPDELAALADGIGRTRETYATLLGGTDEERAAFLDGYEHDLSACTDDRPFFFNYYRYGALFRRLAERDRVTDTGPSYSPDFPVGHLVLLASMAQIALLGGLLILLPLRGLRRSGVPTEGRGRYFVYFAALGVGFMFVEIVLMQKMVIVLGHPTYAVSVVLASLLCFAGIGSLLAGRLRSLGRGTLCALGAAVVVLLVGLAFAVQHLTPLLALPFAGRAAACALLILPVGLALGMAFPTGLRIVGQRAPELLPWCWAINGFLSVFASMLCIALSMAFGFTAMLLAAAAIYGLGFAVMLPARAEGEGEAGTVLVPEPTRKP